MPDSSAQKSAPAFRLAAIDPDFLLGDSTRGVRFQLEYMKAQEYLSAFGIRSTIVVFGSARVREAGGGNHRRWYDEARVFGRIASERGGALNDGPEGRFNVIATGGGPGIHGGREPRRQRGRRADHRLQHHPAARAGAEPLYTPDLTFRFHYFAMRKMHLAMHAAALVVFPGGFGTLDELFEIITLRQTGKMPYCPIVLMDSAYWNAWSISR